MSVTFHPDLAPVIGFAVACCQSAADQAPRYGTNDDARAALADAQLREMADQVTERTVMPGCDIPDVCVLIEYALNVFPVDADHAAPPPSLNASNANAAELLSALGVPGEPCGSLPADDFLGRVLTALAVAPSDPGRPVTVVDTPGTARHYDMGRRPGYLQDKLTDLRAVAEWARDHGREVVWG